MLLKKINILRSSNKLTHTVQHIRASPDIKNMLFIKAQIKDIYNNIYNITITGTPICQPK